LSLCAGETFNDLGNPRISARLVVSDPANFIIDTEGTMFVTFSPTFRAFVWAYGAEVWYK
jgi:hypothetical protein